MQVCYFCYNFILSVSIVTEVHAILTEPVTREDFLQCELARHTQINTHTHTHTHCFMDIVTPLNTRRIMNMPIQPGAHIGTNIHAHKCNTEELYNTWTCIGSQTHKLLFTLTFTHTHTHTHRALEFQQVTRCLLPGMRPHFLITSTCK